MQTAVTLAQVKRDCNCYFESLLDREGPYGAYRGGKGQRPDFYASCDVALSRQIMGEDLSALPTCQRQEWVSHILSFLDSFSRDGRFGDTHGHSPLHANGMAIGALGVLGGSLPWKNQLYQPLDTPEKVACWLEDAVDWSHQWSASHLFWGGMHCFSMGKGCTPAWLDAVFNWLDRELDPQSGFWRKGTPWADPYQPLGGFVHIYPIYQHHNRPFPYPRQVIDSVLSLQRESGCWHEDAYRFNYLSLDALYVYAGVGSAAPGYRQEEVHQSALRYAAEADRYYLQHRQEIFSMHPHQILALVSCYGLLSQLLPEQYREEGRPGWSDIFSDPALYRTALVEAL